MSVQFGRWNFDGRQIDRDYLSRVNDTVIPYGPDDAGHYSMDGISIGFRAFHTHTDSRRTKQPYVLPCGWVMTWDGRLDNRADLVRDLSGRIGNCASDVEIVGAAYEKWGRESLGKLIGDWALVVWNGSTLTLLLASDFMGVRRLYYRLEEHGVGWSTILDPLARLADNRLSLSEEYMAGWLCNFPAAQLTPYVEIRSVPPAAFVLIEDGKPTVGKYWEFDSRKAVRYRTDVEYEEHFRTLFAQSVERRLRSDRPTLAELSGGMDSSAIVCMADAVLAQGRAETPRLDTMSYYSDSEPNWDERPYFTIVEKKRHQTGCHIQAEPPGAVGLRPGIDGFAAVPGLVGGSPESTRPLLEYIRLHGNRVLLSGIGGDEVLGGVPTPTPELADLLARGEWRRLARRAVAWARVQRKPLLHLLGDTVGGFLPPALRTLVQGPSPVPWLTPAFARRNELAVRGFQGRLRLFGPLPSFQEDLQALDGLRRQLAAMPPPAAPLLEKSYPYLDRCLLEFLFAIPREQLVRPGERRSLMRRALATTVPGEVLRRRRKAFAVRTPIEAIAAQWSELVATRTMMVSESLGMIDARRFSEALEMLERGRSVSIIPLARTLTAELWLRQQAGALTDGAKCRPAPEVEV